MTDGKTERDVDFVHYGPSTGGQNYRRRQVDETFEAKRLGPCSGEEIVEWAGDASLVWLGAVPGESLGTKRLRVLTGTGESVFVREGDWVIPEKGGRGFYPCSHADFVDRFEVDPSVPVVVERPEPGERMMKWFEYEHLPEALACVSMRFFELAKYLVDEVPPGPERTVALRKLLESKDAAVRAKLHPGG